MQRDTHTALTVLWISWQIAGVIASPVLSNGPVSFWAPSKSANDMSCSGLTYSLLSWLSRAVKVKSSHVHKTPPNNLVYFRNNFINLPSIVPPLSRIQSRAINRENEVGCICPSFVRQSDDVLSALISYRQLRSDATSGLIVNFYRESRPVRGNCCALPV